MLKQRIITALLLLPIALGGFFLLDGASFALFIGAVVALGGWEWARLAGLAAQSLRARLARLAPVLAASFLTARNVFAALMVHHGGTSQLLFRSSRNR